MVGIEETEATGDVYTVHHEHNNVVVHSIILQYM